MIVLLTFIPTLAPPNRRRALSGAIAVTLLGVSVCMAPISLAAMQRNFYGQKERTPSVAFLSDVIGLGGVTYSGSNEAIPKIVASRGFTIRGYAVDSISGLPADRVVIELDGARIRQISTGRPEPEIASLYHDGALNGSGFEVRLDTTHWTPGMHTIALAIRSNGGVLMAFPRTLEVRVIARAGER